MLGVWLACICAFAAHMQPLHSWYHSRVESKVAKEARLALLADAKRLTPEQRLNAFLEHCQLVMQLYAAGQKIRSDSKMRQT